MVRTEVVVVIVVVMTVVVVVGVNLVVCTSDSESAQRSKIHLRFSDGLILSDSQS